VGFVFKCLLVLFIFAFIVYVLKALARLRFYLRSTAKDVQKMRQQMKGRTADNSEMVRCHTCGAFVASGEAVTLAEGKRQQSFCSRACLQAHARTASA
jgi:hypothetical protein